MQTKKLSCSFYILGFTAIEEQKKRQINVLIFKNFLVRTPPYTFGFETPG